MSDLVSRLLTAISVVVWRRGLLSQLGKGGIRLPQILAAPGSEPALDNLLGDSHHEDPRHPLDQDVPHPGGHPVSARLPGEDDMID